MSQLTIDIYHDGIPKRGDLLQSAVGTKRERTWFILGARQVKPRLGVPRYKVWTERWWEIEPEMRMRLFASSERRGGQNVICFRRYPAKRKPTFEQYLRRDLCR